MAIVFDKVEPDFVKLRKFILDDLDRILQQDTGGNYAATALIVCVCDALARLRYGSKNAGGRFFADMMLPKMWRQVGCSIYEALRNGLVHTYETKKILVAGREIELVVSWRERPHLESNRDKDFLYLNVKTMAENLRRAFDRYREELVKDGNLCARFHKTIRKDAVVTVRRPNEIATWKALLETNAEVHEE